MTSGLNNFQQFCETLDESSPLRIYQRAIGQLIVERGGDLNREVFPTRVASEAMASLCEGMAANYDDLFFLRHDFEKIGSMNDLSRKEIRDVFKKSTHQSISLARKSSANFQKITELIPILYDKILKCNHGQQSGERELLDLMIQWYPESARLWLASGSEESQDLKLSSQPQNTIEPSNQTQLNEESSHSSELPSPIELPLENKSLEEYRFTYPIDREVSIWLGVAMFGTSVILFAALGWIFTGLIIGFSAFVVTYIFHLSLGEVIFREDGVIYLDKNETLYVLSFDDVLRVEITEHKTDKWIKLIFFSSEIEDLQVPFHFKGFARLENWIEKYIGSRVLRISEEVTQLNSESV